MGRTHEILLFNIIYYYLLLLFHNIFRFIICFYVGGNPDKCDELIMRGAHVAQCGDEGDKTKRIIIKIKDGTRRTKRRFPPLSKWRYLRGGIDLHLGGGVITPIEIAICEKTKQQKN